MKPIILTFGGKRLVAPSGKAIFRYGTATIGGVTYKTVKIGNQEWMAENLKLDDSGTGIYTFDNSSTYSAGEVIYQQTAALRIAQSIGDDWRIPSTSDIEDLCTNTSVTLLTSTQSQDPDRTYSVLLNRSAWEYEDGTDDYGFNLLPVGFKDSNPWDSGRTTNLWTSATPTSSSDSGYHFYINFGTDSNQLHGAYLANNGNRNTLYSVRLVRNL
jgi:uncharacterized protein (TIGR02145 family)